MATEIKIPIPDQTTEEVRIVKWHKAAGDQVAKGEVVLEVETDKSVIEVESAGEGVFLKGLFIENDMVPVGEVVGFVGQAGEEVDAPAAAATNSGAAETPAAAATAGEVALPDGAVEVKIPIPDQTTQEVRVVKWHKAENDAVAKGEVVLEVETDKSVIEVESIGAGVLLNRLYAENDMVPVGEVVGVVGPAGTKIDAGSLRKAEPAKAAAPAASPASAPSAPAAAPSAAPVIDSRIKASPAARILAQKLGVDLTQVRGNGPQGRIMKDDVQHHFDNGGMVAGVAVGAAMPVLAKFVDGRILASPNAKRLAKELGIDLQYVQGTGQIGRIVGDDVKKAAQAGTARVGMVAAAAAVPPVSLEPVAGQPQPGTTVELSKMRRAIGTNLQASSRDIPHFNVTMAINMSRALKFRTKFNGTVDKSQKVSVNDLVVRAVAVALRQYPRVNSRLKDDAITYLPDVNIGIATAIQDGLVVPVVLNADKYDWLELAAETKRIAQSARQGKIVGMGRGTFTISNLGMFGVEQFTAIINPPEAAILAVGGTTEEVVAVDGMIGVQPIMRITLCSDHRLIDGALAAEFLRAMKFYLEEQIG